MALTIDWRLNQQFTVTSITSWDDGFLFNPDNTDGSPLNIFKIPYIGDTRQVTQDLRLTSSTRRPVRLHRRHLLPARDDLQFDREPDPQPGRHQQHAIAKPPRSAPGAGYYAGSVINPGCRYFNSFDQIRNSWAVYNDDSYSLSDLFKLRAGLRYTHEDAEQKNALDQLRGSDDVPIANLGFFSEQHGPNGPYFGPALVAARLAELRRDRR